MAGEHAGHRQRMRERFLKQGLDGFAPHEVLELMLFYAIPQRNVNPLAHRLIDHFGSFHAVLDAPVEELMKVEGVGEYAAALVSLFSHVARRLEKSRSGTLEVLSNRRMAEEHCRRLLGGLRQEHFYVVCLNGQMQVIQDVLIARGSLSEVQAYPRQVVEAVLRHNAHSVVLCHNHPGGSIVPSQQDMDVTRTLMNILQGIEVRMIDHIIVADNRTLSMVECHLIEHRMKAGVIEPRAADSAGEVRIRAELEKAQKK